MNVAEEYTLELYQHARDYASVVEICKDVYGGTDYMPRMVEHYSKEDNVLVYVARNRAGVVDAVSKRYCFISSIAFFYTAFSLMLACMLASHTVPLIASCTFVIAN
jgi:hypothetical protein